MKLSTKIILPIILISALLILLAGCFGVPADESPGYTPGTITGIIASPCCSTSAEPVSETCCIAPEYWCFYCQKTWSLQDGIEVALTYGEDEVATVFTNKDGEFTFTNVDPGKNYVVTAYCPDFDDNRPLIKDVALEIIEGGSFDTKITDLVSTSLGLVVDFLVLYTEWGPEDISLDEVLADRPNFPSFPKFKKLVYEVRRVVENCEVNLLTDDDVQDALCRAAEEISKLDIGCGPGYTPPPPPPPGPCEGNIAPSINSVLLDGTAVSIGETVNVVVETPYVVTVNASDPDGILGTLTYSATIDGIPVGTVTSNVVTVTPLVAGTFEVYVHVFDGCLTTTWGPVYVDVCQPINKVVLVDGVNDSICVGEKVALSTLISKVETYAAGVLVEEITGPCDPRLAFTFTPNPNGVATLDAACDVTGVIVGDVDITVTYTPAEGECGEAPVSGDAAVGIMVKASFISFALSTDYIEVCPGGVDTFGITATYTDGPRTLYLNSAGVSYSTTGGVSVSSESTNQITATADGTIEVCYTDSGPCGTAEVCETINVTVLPGFESFALSTDYIEVCPGGVDTFGITATYTDGPRTLYLNSAGVSYSTTGGVSVSSESTNQITATADGTIEVCYTDSGPCGTAEVCETINVTVLPGFESFALSTDYIEVCPGGVDTFGITATYTDGPRTLYLNSAGVSYSTTGGVSVSSESTNQITATADGTIEVCYTDSGPCGTAEVCETINVTVLPGFESFALSTDYIEVCPGGVDTFGITATYTDGPRTLYLNSAGVSYSTTGGVSVSSESTNQITATADGTIEVCYTDSGPCGTAEVCETINVTVLPGFESFALSTDYIEVCPGGVDTFGITATYTDGPRTLYLNSAGVSYSTTGGVSVSSESTNQITATADGTIEVCYTDSGPCGTAEVCETINVTVLPGFESFALSTDYIEVCPGGVDTFGITATYTDGPRTLYLNSAGVSYSTTGGVSVSSESTNQITATADGTIEVCYTDSGPCGTAEVCETINVTVLPGFESFALSTDYLVLCVGLPATFGITATYSDGDRTLYLNSPGVTYTVSGDITVTDESTNEITGNSVGIGSIEVCYTDSGPCGTDEVCATINITVEADRFFLMHNKSDVPIALDINDTETIHEVPHNANHVYFGVSACNDPEAIIEYQTDRIHCGGSVTEWRQVLGGVIDPEDVLLCNGEITLLTIRINYVDEYEFKILRPSSP